MTRVRLLEPCSPCDKSEKGWRVAAKRHNDKEMSTVSHNVHNICVALEWLHFYSTYKLVTVCIGLLVLRTLNFAMFLQYTNQQKLRCYVRFTWMFARGLLQCNASPRGPKREGGTEAKRETLELR